MWSHLQLQSLNTPKNNARVYECVQVLLYVYMLLYVYTSSEGLLQPVSQNASVTAWHLQLCTSDSAYIWYMFIYNL